MDLIMEDLSTILLYFAVLVLCGVAAMYFTRRSTVQPQSSKGNTDSINVIKLTHPSDIGFARIAQMASVGGATLPSGFKVPSDGDWIIRGDTLVRQ